MDWKVFGWVLLVLVLAVLWLVKVWCSHGDDEGPL